MKTRYTVYYYKDSIRNSCHVTTDTEIYFGCPTPFCRYIFTFDWEEVLSTQGSRFSIAKEKLDSVFQSHRDNTLYCFFCEATVGFYDPTFPDQYFVNTCLYTKTVSAILFHFFYYYLSTFIFSVYFDRFCSSI